MGSHGKGQSNHVSIPVWAWAEESVGQEDQSEGLDAWKQEMPT